MPKIHGPGSNQPTTLGDVGKKKESSSSFGATLKSAATGTLDTVATASSMVPGGGLIGAAAQGLKALLGGGDSASMGGQQDQLDKMWAMQKESQMFNMQYLQLQTEIQNDNRAFSTMSNLMKVRHDTAKSAINNMHV